MLFFLAPWSSSHEQVYVRNPFLRNQPLFLVIAAASGRTRPPLSRVEYCSCEKLTLRHNRRCRPKTTFVNSANSKRGGILAPHSQSITSCAAPLSHWSACSWSSSHWASSYARESCRVANSPSAVVAQEGSDTKSVTRATSVSLSTLDQSGSVGYKS